MSPTISEDEIIYEPKRIPISFGEACQEMWSICQKEKKPVIMYWNNLQVIIRRYRG